MNERAKITANHLSRQAINYLRQSSAAQVENNRESTDRQYALAAKARELGWPADRIVVTDEDLGLSGSGFVARSGFARLTAEVALGHVGLVLGLEVSRLARNNADWHRLIELGGLTDTLIGDADGIYHPGAAQSPRRKVLMRLLAPLVILGAGFGVALIAPGGTRIAGLDPQTFAWAASLVAMLVYLLARTRALHLARVVSSVSIWVGMLLALTGAYSYRFEVSDFVGRVASELMPSEPQVGEGGEVIVNRRLNGEFAVAAKVNGARVTFLFDTGASVVVLTAADARRAGIDTRGLDFDVPVTTANGAAMAAEVRLDSIEVGPIVMRNVCALVARPGALEESLLGMSFLERLKSYAVERGRLILTAR